MCIGNGTVHAVGLGEGRAPRYRDRSIPNDATDVVSFGSSVLAFGDGALAYELGAGLDAARRVDLAGARRSLTAQPTLDPATGELHLLTFASDPSQLHVRVSPGGLTRTIRSIDNAPNRIRQLALTRDDVVLLADGFVGVTGRTGARADATWFAVDTDARRLATADADGEAVVVHTTGPSLVRWALHRRTATADSQVIDATPQTVASRNGCLLWTVGSGAVHEHDLVAGTRRSHDFGEGRHPGAFVFVTDPERTRLEDGGWLVGLVHDETRRETELVVLDAHAIVQPAVAVARIPRRIALGARGAWASAVQI